MYSGKIIKFLAFKQLLRHFIKNLVIDQTADPFDCHLKAF